MLAFSVIKSAEINRGIIATACEDHRLNGLLLTRAMLEAASGAARA